MKRMKLVALFGALLCGFTAVLQAELSFENPQITIEATPDMEESVGVFEFTNTGDEPILIQRVQSSCGCTVPELKKHEYAPGESGEITAVFTFGQRQGRQSKHLGVYTDHGNYNLELTTIIPARYKMEPRLLAWVDEGRQEKTVDVTFMQGQPVEITNINDLKGYNVEVVTVKEGEQYQLKVKPVAETLPATEALRFEALDSEGHKERMTLFLRYLQRHNKS
ncbi:MAG: hypothetical protein E1N59_205 [Puniceicoccaceae bacterium 5H]|nr:MAG: hypothetical protein E1N59_205 [Puniceicoccaceae bacterium 5H]